MKKLIVGGVMMLGLMSMAGAFKGAQACEGSCKKPKTTDPAPAPAPAPDKS